MKVTVCIPVYGVEKYIERCARSLFEQTLKEDIEFIFVDDCTPDKSIEILLKLLEEYPERKNQVKLLRHEKNKGLIGARNSAVEAASGTYVIHCDSDDWVEKDMYARLLETAEREDADMVCTSCALEYDDAPAVNIKLPPQGEGFEQAFMDCNLYWGLWSKLVRTEIARDSRLYAPEHLCYSEDLLRVAQMLALTKKVSVVPAPLYHYYQGNRNSYSKVFKRAFLDQQLEIVRWLEENQTRFSLLSIKGDILFHGIVRGLWSGDEIRELWKSEHRKIVCYRGLHWVKRCVVLSAFISYPLTVRLCRQLFAKRYGLKRDQSVSSGGKE